MATQIEPEKKKNKYNLTPQEEQQEKLNRLFEKIDKPVFIPNKQEDKAFVPPPKDFVRNVAGSSAGAGSGDFHVYRAQRRREYARLKVMEDEEKKEKEQREYEEKLKRLRQADEERTAKKRAKRQKRSKNKKDTKEKKDTDDDTVKNTKEDSPEQQQQQ